MATPTNDYVLRFATEADSAFTKDEAMELARSQGMSLRDFILNALVHERERIDQTQLVDDWPLTDEQFAWLWAQFPEGTFEDEERIGPALW